MGHPTREELLTEYYKLIDLIYNYDSYLVQIKTGSISLGSIAAGIGIGLQSIYPVFLVVILSLAFWFTEASFKVVQLSNFKRVKELENALGSWSYENTNFPAPRIIQGYSENRKANEESKLWWKVIWWKHVMFPHILFLIGGLVGMLVSLILSLF